MMSDKQLQFHTWVKDSNQLETGKHGIRIRCIRSHAKHTLTVYPKELKTYGVPDFQYAGEPATQQDQSAEGSSDE